MGFHFGNLKKKRKTECGIAKRNKTKRCDVDMPWLEMMNWLGQKTSREEEKHGHFNSSKSATEN